MKIKKIRIEYVIAAILVASVIIISITVSLNKTEKQEKKEEEISSYILDELPLIGNFDTLYNLITFETKEQKEELIENIIKNEKNEVSVDTNQATEKPQIAEEEPKESLEKEYNNYKYEIKENAIIVTDINDVENPVIVEEISFENTETKKFIPIEIKVTENKLVVAGKTELYNEKIEEIKKEDSEDIEEVTTYEYNKSYATVKIYNIADIKNISLYREISLQGDYFTTKVYGENLYLITRLNIDSEKYKDISKEELNQEEFKVEYRDTYNNKEDKINFNQMYYIPNTINNDYLNVISINFNKEEDAKVNTFFGLGDQITVLEDSLDVEIEEDEYKDVTLFGYYDNTKEIKYIYKFKLENGLIKYKKIEKAL